jgi:arylformamidase
MRRDNDPVWLDQQYNNRALVPDFASHMEKWAKASAFTREQAACTLDVPYGDDATEKLDVFHTTAANAPVLVFIHGGYWRALDKSDHSFVAPSFTAAGALVVVPNYAMAPAVTVEHITLQMVKAVEWVWRHAPEHGGDPSRIVVAGHSAGGHLAAMMVSTRWKQVADDLPANLVHGALAISGLYDLEPIRHTPFLQKDLQLTPASVRRLSPAFFPRPKGKLHALVGADESSEFIRQNQLIRDVWGPTAVPVCEKVAGANHFSVLKHLADPDARLHQLGLKLLGLR